MIQTLLKFFNLTTYDTIYNERLKLNKCLMDLTDKSKLINKLYTEIEELKKDKIKLENKLKMYEDPDNWYKEYETKLSLVAAGLLKTKDKK